MEETKGYWESKLAEFEEAIELEMQMENPNNDMLKLLKFEKEECLKQLQ